MHRLEKNWSQETLCHGICAVSYLSKIEQGKVCANTALLKALFNRLDIEWQNISLEADAEDCENLYEKIFADEELSGDISLVMGANFLDYLVIRAYSTDDNSVIPPQMVPLLDNRQRCLLYLLEENYDMALSVYPCALTAQYAGIHAYRSGEYMRAVGLLQQAYDMACQNGYAMIMMNAQTFIANCYSDLRIIPEMLSHYRIARRLATALNNKDMIQAISYNIASTQIECGEYEAGYRYFSVLENPNELDLHKLAVCCEKLGKREEAYAALDKADFQADSLEKEMCHLVRYRLDHPEYLNDMEYGDFLLSVFQRLRENRPKGYAVFHLPWVEEWCIVNRKYRMIYEITKDFPNSSR